MEHRPGPVRGLTLLDGAAMVTGAAVASVHVREVVPTGLPAVHWVLVWITFAGIALTAAGPFLFLGRWLGRLTPGYPRTGDLLWTMWGLPWLATALLRTASRGAGSRGNDLVSIILTGGLGLATLIALGVVWKTWVLVPAEQLRQAEPTPWTNRVGLVLSVAWPLQCGFGLIVLEGPS